MATYKRMLMLERTAREEARKGSALICDIRSDGVGLNTHLQELKNLHSEDKSKTFDESDSEVDLPIEGDDDNSKQQAFVYKWSRRALKAWQEDLAQRPESERSAIECKHEIAQYRQSRR